MAAGMATVLWACASDIIENDDGSVAKEALISWSATSVSAVLGQEFESPGFSNPNDLPVSFSSSNTAVATVDAAGAVSLKGIGYTEISAESEGNDSFSGSSAERSEPEETESSSEKDTITDQPEKQIVAEMIREKALHALNEEVPHGIAVTIDLMKKRKGQKVMDIEATIICERESHKGIIIGKGGEMLKKIGTNARYEIEKMLDMQVNLKLWVKVKKNWRDNDVLMKNFGYDKKRIDE